MIFFDFAWRSIRLNWLRSLLAVIGIVIGVVAISSMGMLGNSLQLSVTEDLSTVGDTLVIFPHASDTLTERQFKNIERAAGQYAAIPIYAGHAERIEVGNEKGVALIYGIRPDDIPDLLEKAEGAYTQSDGSVMAGATLAEEFDLRVGSRIKAGNTSFRVAGILEEKGIGFDINPDSALVATDHWYSSYYDQDEYDQVIIRVSDLEDIEDVKEAIDKRLNRRETEVDILDTGAILEMITTAFESIAAFTTAIGGISLVVAGVSIFNVQMMSVTERIREIGIIRSIGTRRLEVMKMFMYEALILGLIGSSIGAVLSFGGGYVTSLFMLQTVKYIFLPSTLIYIPYGMVFGIITSLLSGLYPAWKAANLNPIDALRYE